MRLAATRVLFGATERPPLLPMVAEATCYEFIIL